MRETEHGTRRHAQQFGTYGAWLNPSSGDHARIGYAPELEDLGFRTIWLGIGAGTRGSLDLIEQVVSHTRTAMVASAIINVWRIDPHSVAYRYHQIVDRHGPRVVLGIGLGHPERVEDYTSPYRVLEDFVDILLAQRVPAEAIVLAALSARTLRLASARTLGAHPYLTVPEHTRRARDIMGDNAFLAPEHKVVLTDNPSQGREIGRTMVRDPYLQLRNYRKNLQRHGFTEADVAGAGSDRLIDALVASGDPSAIRRRLDDHLTAGADHVGVQVLTAEPTNSPMPAFRALAQHLRA